MTLLGGLDEIEGREDGDRMQSDTVVRSHPLPRLWAVLAPAGLAFAVVLTSAQAASAAPAAIPLTSSSCPVNMAKGEIDGCVTTLQQLLNSKDHAGLTVDGNFGTRTFNAVETYQSDNGLSRDGIVGPKTKASLTGSSGAPAPTPPSGSVLAKAVSYAHAIENGSAEPGWNGGKITYVWGGGHKSTPGPTTGTCVGDPQSISCTHPATVGLDCSGFARWVYDLAYGRDVLGTTGSSGQKSEMHKVSTPVAGDLVFFGANGTPSHVGVYIGNGQMINAYETGTNIETDAVTRPGEPLIGYYQY